MGEKNASVYDLELPFAEDAPDSASGPNRPAALPADGDGGGPDKGPWLLTRVVLPLGIVIGAIAVLAISVLARPKPEQKERTALPPLVDTVVVKKSPSAIRIPVSGVVLPRREVTISAEVKGRVINKPDEFLAGRQLKKNDLLVELDKKPYELEAARLKSELAKVDADLAKLAVDRKNNEELVELAGQSLGVAQRQKEREEKLVARGSRARLNLDTAISDFLRAKDALAKLRNEGRSLAASEAQLKAQKQLAQANLEKAEYDLARTEIRMPVDGVVAECGVESGGFVAAGGMVGRIDDVSVMEVRCDIRRSDMDWLLRAQSPGEVPAGPGRAGYRVPPAPAQIRYTVNGRTFEYAGTLARLEGSGVRQQTRTLPCRIRIEQTGDENAGKPFLLKGSFVQGELLASGPLTSGLLELPVAALRTDEGLPKVWRVVGGELDVVPARVARYRRETALIYVDEGGIKPGDEVIISPLSRADDGMKLRVR